MRIAVIDADLIGRKRHRFPNLASMKISGYHKEQGHEVHLLTDYERIDEYDRVFISKVFTDTPVPAWVVNRNHVEYGGTGFFFDQAPDLPPEIEHHMPDYHLYDDFIAKQMLAGVKRSEFKEYLDYSIGYITRGCFRKCDFCVNRKYDRVFLHSPLEEFYDPARPKICLLDDNVFGHPHWRKILKELSATGKPFKFKQGLDERLLTDEKCELLCQAKYDGEITFAFDNIMDYGTVKRKLQMIRRYTDKRFTFYVLVAFDHDDRWDDAFWIQDIIDAFERIRLLMQYGCLPYIMRFNRYEDSPMRGMYITLARWCNQPSQFKKKSFREFVESIGETSAAMRYLREFESLHPDIAREYFDLKWDEVIR